MGLLFSPIFGGLRRSRATIGACCYINCSGLSHSCGGQQSQLLRHRHDQLLEAMHFLLEFLPISLPIAVCDQPLNRASRKIGDAARPFLLANADELTELVFRYTEVH